MDKVCIVKNRSGSTVIYKIPEDNIRREFAPGESRRINYEELIHLSFQPGGRELMENFLQIEDESAINELNLRAEPEYYMNESQIVDLIKTGSLDEFLDCLDFAPIGVLDLLKDYSVKVPLSDYDKKKALKDKTGFDVDKALANLDADRAEENEPSSSSSRRSRANYKAEAKPAAAPVRKTVSKSK